METISIFDEYALAKPMPASVSDHFIPWVQVPSGSRTLDVGCGDGRFLEFCAAVAPQSRPVGLEISWVRARRTADKGLSVLQADSEQLPFASGSFHLVLLIEVIEHVWRPDAVMAEIARILQPEGRLILTTPNYPAKRGYDWLKYLQGVCSSPADDPTHFSPFSARRVRKLCSRYFTSVESQAHHIAGEGRWPVLARLKKSPGIGDWIGHKIMLFCQHPRSRAMPYEQDYFEEYGSNRRCYEQRLDNPFFTRILQEIEHLGYTDGRLLDVGCAYGFFLAQAERAGFTTWGVDISNYAIEQAQKHTSAMLSVADIAFEPLSYGDSFFDVITVLDVLEHLENYHHALREIARVLRPRGLLVVYGPGFKRGLHEPTHRAFFTMESLHVVLAQHGFEILISGERGGRWNKVWGVLNLVRRRDRLFNFAWLGHGSFIACYARKPVKRDEYG